MERAFGQCENSIWRPVSILRMHPTFLFYPHPKDQFLPYIPRISSLYPPMTPVHCALQNAPHHHPADTHTSPLLFREFSEIKYFSPPEHLYKHQQAYTLPITEISFFS